jgi:hypothetical protein
MGNDGGNIPTRFDLVKTRSRERKRVTKELKKASTRLCNLSKSRLTPPICICRKGFIFNKLDLISAILEKSLPSHLCHIKSLKDIKEVPLPSSYKEGEEIVFRCPISLEECNGNNDFYFLWKCRCLVSKSALSKLGLKIDKTFRCPNCNLENNPEDLVLFAKDDVSVEEEKLAKRSKDEFEQMQKAESSKSIVNPSYFMSNIIDRISESAIYKKEIDNLFHKSNNDEKKRDIFFPNCRHGTR